VPSHYEEPYAETRRPKIPTVSFVRQEKRGGVVRASKVIVMDSHGKERISLFVENETAMLALYDKREAPRFLIAVQGDGSALMSALHSVEGKVIYEDTFRLVISAGEPEIVMQDAIFKNGCRMSPDGFVTFGTPPDDQ